jgi:hypothetical protein
MAYQPMRMTISWVDYAPDDLYDQTPFDVDLLREIPGSDRPDYWVGALLEPLRWEEKDREITHLVLAARWQGTSIGLGMKNLPVGIAYVTDSTLLDNGQLDFSKCAYVAIGMVKEVKAI